MGGKKSTVLAVLGLWATSMPARAEVSRFFEVEGFGHFLDGNPDSTAVTEDGAIALPPASTERFGDAATSFSAACALGDEVIVARVEDAQVQAIDAKGRIRPIYKPQEALVTALLAHQEAIYVAAGPGGKIYRVEKNGTAKLFAVVEANYVWSLAPGPHGLLAATGEPGGISQIGLDGKVKRLFAPEQLHMRAVAWDPVLGIFAGGAERGVLYRAPPGGSFAALYDTGMPEITALVLHDGAAYIAGVAGAASVLQDEEKKAGGKPPEVRSQVLRVFVDGTSEVLAGSSDEAVFALAIDNQNKVLVGTGATGRDDPRGRIYSIDPPRRVISLLVQVPARRVTHLVRLAHNVVAVTAAGGRITELSAVLARQGEFYTQPFDAGINATFGLAQLLGSYPPGTRAEVAARSGQTADPDASWSAWSKNIEAPGNKSVQLPNGRFAQMRLTLYGKHNSTPLVQRLRLAYLRQNLAPFVREVTVMRKGTALYALPREDPKAAKMVMLTDKGDDAARTTEEATRRSVALRARQAQERGALTIKWLSDDPNGDELLYDLSVRPSDQNTWRTLRRGLEDPFVTLKAGQFADGHYVFAVRASDARANPKGLGRSDQRESRITLIDNTAPQFSPIKVTVPNGQVEARATVKDGVGPIVELYYALDAADSAPVLPDDGLLDGPEERISLYLGRLSPGPHTLTLRALDEADNEGFAQASFVVKN